jgi:hypothetical protein
MKMKRSTGRSAEQTDVHTALCSHSREALTEQVEAALSHSPRSPTAGVRGPGPELPPEGLVRAEPVAGCRDPNRGQEIARDDRGRIAGRQMQRLNTNSAQTP